MSVWRLQLSSLTFPSSSACGGHGRIIARSRHHSTSRTFCPVVRLFRSRQQSWTRSTRDTRPLRQQGQKARQQHRRTTVRTSSCRARRCLLLKSSYVSTRAVRSPQMFIGRWSRRGYGLRRESRKDIIAITSVEYDTITLRGVARGLRQS